MLGDNLKKQYSGVKYPSWFLDTEQDYIVNIVSQAYDLGHTSQSQEAKKYLRQHLHSRFGGEWEIKILNVKDQKKFNETHAGKEKGQPFYINLHLNDVSYTMWKKK